MSEDESDRENLTELWGYLTGLIQGCITFSVSPLESQNNFVFSLLNRYESGLLYTKSGRNLSLLTQSQGKVYVSYIMSQGLKSGARVPSINVIKMLGLFSLPSCFWLSGLCFEACIQNQKGLKIIGDEGWDEVKPEILMKILNISRFVIKHWEWAAQPGYRSLSSLPTSEWPHRSAGESQIELKIIVTCLGVQPGHGIDFHHGPG